MNIQIKTEVMTSQDIEAKILRAIMFAVFEDYVLDVSAEEFQKRWGTRGTECLSKYTKLEKEN